MPTVMVMHWPEVTKEQYEAVRKDVNWEGKKPPGGKYHVAWFDGGLRVVDVWDSAQDFQRFVEQRLTPGTQKAGIKGQPKVQFFEAHATFAPNP
jgi:heme-degrading monooxygenase HmoA